MAEGQRDAFIENDVIGNYNAGTNFLGGVSSRKRKRTTKKRRKKSFFKRIFKRKSTRRKRRVHKSNKRSSGGIKYTKNGQPYKILANGRARFIKGKRKK